MADDAQITEDYHHLSKKGTSPFFYAKRYVTKEKYIKYFCMFF